MVNKISKLNDLKWLKWRRSLEAIEKQLVRLETSRRVYNRLHDIIRANDTLSELYYHIFFNWLTHNYCVYLGMGIRRLVDTRSDRLNLYKLLLDIEKQRQQITVSNLARSYLLRPNGKWGKAVSKSHEGDLYEGAKRAYRDAFGRCRIKLLARDIATDKGTIGKLAKNEIEKYVDENWAHMGKKKVMVPNTNEAHKCLDEFLKIFNKYSLLIRGKKLLLPDDDILFVGWENPFKIPWIK